MNKLFPLLASLTLAIPAGATPRAIDNGLMVNDPYFGPSRVETVNFCLGQVGVDNVNDLITDSHLEGYESCMIEHT